MNKSQDNYENIEFKESSVLVNSCRCCWLFSSIFLILGISYIVACNVINNQNNMNNFTSSACFGKTLIIN